MKKIVGILPAILVALAVVEAQPQTPAKPSDTTDKILIANERALHDAVGKADKTSFMSLVLPDGVWTSQQGWLPMHLLVDALAEFKLSKWDIANPRVTWLGEDSAIVLYVWKGTGTFHGQPVAPTTLASTVWTKRDGKWLAVHHQQTDIKN